MNYMRAMWEFMKGTVCAPPEMPPVPTTRRSQEDRHKELMTAVLSGSVKGVVCALGAGSDASYNNNEALITAAGMEDVGLLSVLVANGADINARCGGAMNVACTRGNLNLLRYLISAGACYDFNGYSSVAMACEYGHIAVVRELLRAGCPPRVPGNELLRRACRYKQRRIIELLVHTGAPIADDNYEPVKISIGVWEFRSAAFMLAEVLWRKLGRLMAR